MIRPRVVIADDHPFVLDGLIKLLQDKFDVVAAVRDGTLLLDAALHLQPDVIVTDISMPRLSGMEAFERLTAAGCTAKLIILTMHADAELAARMLRSGASGFVMKLLAANELVTAIEHVLAGGTYLTPTLTAFHGIGPRRP